RQCRHVLRHHRRLVRRRAARQHSGHKGSAPVTDAPPRALSARRGRSGFEMMAMTAPLRARASTFLIAFPIIALAALLPAQAEARAEATPAPTVAAEAATARGAAAADRGDFAEALRWYAAEKGSAEAQFEIGVLYDTGQGVAQDAAEAMRWYRMAADQGLDRAQVQVGAPYECGGGVRQNCAEAMRWHRKAAAQGLASAQNNIGALYGTGLGVAQDNAEAMRWYRMGAA